MTEETEYTQEEIASEIQGRYDSLRSDMLKLEKKLRSLQEDAQKVQGWLYEVQQEAREAGVELDF